MMKKQAVPVALEVIGFGALNLDYIYQLERPRLREKLARFIRPGNELAINVGEFDHLLGVVKQIGTWVGQSSGGQAANTVAALSRLGVACGCVGKVGQDEAGGYILASLQGVDKQGLARGGRSGRCLSLLNEARERCMLISPGCNDELGPEEVRLDYLNQARLVYLSSFVGDSPLQAQIEAVRQLSPQVSLALDPGELYARRGLSAIEELLNRCRLVFIAEEEIKLLTGEGYKAGARQILTLGVEMVVCKRGEEGAYVLSQTEEFELPVERVSAVDRTGAGDVFAAGFIAGWLKKLGMRECTLLGHKAAVHSLMGVGRESYPNREFLNNFLTKIPNRIG